VIYVVDPVLTGDSERARAFFDAALPLLETAGAMRLSSEETCDLYLPAGEDAVLLVNSGASLPEAVEDVVHGAVQRGAVVFPVALDVETRAPASPATGRQSFDVADALRRRGLPPSALATVAEEFARQVLAKMLPTMAPDRARVFLSYRRSDGEPMAARLGDALARRHVGHVFRDLDTIDPSADARTSIERALDMADVLVLLDTFDTAGSTWVDFEVAEALSRGIPVVWVRFTYDESAERARERLRVRPQGDPQLVVEVVRDADDVAVEDIADQVLSSAFSVAQQHARTALATFRRIRREAGKAGKSVETLDGKRLIYQVSDPAAAAPWPRRARVDVLQVFARHPRDEDRANLVAWLEEERMGPHGRACRSYDAAVLLDPRPVVAAQVASDGTVVAGSGNYLEHLAQAPQATARAAERSSPWLLLLGAHPAAEQGYATSAAEALLRVWLDRGGRVALGGHPTFVPMVVQQARRIVDGGPRRVRVYQSAYFPPSAVLQQATDAVEVVGTPDAGTRDASLTVMRRQMVGDLPDAAVVAVGGRTDEDGRHRPGLVEECSWLSRRDWPYTCSVRPAAGRRTSRSRRATTPMPACRTASAGRTTTTCGRARISMDLPKCSGGTPRDAAEPAPDLWSWAQLPLSNASARAIPAAIRSALASAGAITSSCNRATRSSTSS